MKVRFADGLIAWDFASKKTGHDLAPGTDEKITDGLRGAYEKFSGKKVDPKVCCNIRQPALFLLKMVGRSRSESSKLSEHGIGSPRLQD